MDQFSSRAWGKARACIVAGLPPRSIFNFIQFSPKAVRLVIFFFLQHYGETRTAAGAYNRPARRV